MAKMLIQFQRNPRIKAVLVAYLAFFSIAARHAAPYASPSEMREIKKFVLGAKNIKKKKTQPAPLIDLRSLVHQTEARFELPKHLLHAVVKVESSYNPHAYNPVGVPSFGLVQITADTARARCGMTVAQVKIPKNNLKCGAKILKENLAIYQNLDHALAAYNAGTACVCDGRKWVNALDGANCRVFKNTAQPVRYCSKDKEDEILNRSYVRKIKTFLAT